MASSVLVRPEPGDMKEVTKRAVEALLDGRRIIRRIGIVGWREEDWDAAACLMHQSESAERRHYEVVQ